MGFLAWLGLEDDDVTRRNTRKRRQKRQPRQKRQTEQWRVEAGELRTGRDPDLPDICTGDFTGKVRVDGKSIKFIDGVRQ